MAILQNILRHPAIWRGGDMACAEPGIETGYSRLDALLPGGGWPRGSLTEILAPQEGAGELSLLLPALARLSREGRWVAFVAPPYIPYAPALSRAGIDLSRYLLVRARSPEGKRWAVEQALRSGTCGAVVFWPGSLMEDKHWRRLQLAAEEGDALGFSFNARQDTLRQTPVALRLRLTPDQGRLRVEVLKRRGGGMVTPLSIALTEGLERPASAVAAPLPSVKPAHGWHPLQAKASPAGRSAPGRAYPQAETAMSAVWGRALAPADEARSSTGDPRLSQASTAIPGEREAAVTF